MIEEKLREIEERLTRDSKDLPGLSYKDGFFVARRLVSALRCAVEALGYVSSYDNVETCVADHSSPAKEALAQVERILEWE